MLSDSKAVTAIRSEVCNTTARWLLLPGSIGLILSISRAMHTGWQAVMSLHAAMLVLFSVLAIAQNRIPYSIRASLLVAAMFLLGTGSNFAFGLPMGNAFYVSASIMAGVFFGERVGIAFAVASFAAVMANYAATQMGFVSVPEYQRTIPTVVGVGAALIIASLGPLIALSRFKRQLDLERQRAEEASLSKSRFLAMMSHELRTPMAGILGIADLLLEDDLPPDQEERVARIARSGKALLDILNDLLDFSKIEAERLALESIPFDLENIIDEVFELLQPLAAERGLDMELDLQPGMVNALGGDPIRLRQIIINLVGNAIKFTERGWVKVAVSQAKTGRGPINLEVEVSDTGIGVAPEQLEKLFQPFSQADTATWRRYGGTGLGLAISKRLAQMMGGDLVYMPRAGGGSIFRLNVAVSENIATVNASSFEAARKVHRADRPLNILVADDNETLRYLLEKMLRRWGHDVTAVEDGAAALHAVRTQDFDVVVMDMQMPVMHGVEATRRIRELGGVKGRIPIIALTADIVAEHRLVYQKSGVDAVISKPVDWLELATELERQSSTAFVEDPPHLRSPSSTSGESRSDPSARPAMILDPTALSAISEDMGPEELDTLLRAFKKNLRQYSDDIQSAYAQGDMSRVQRVAHTLKGLCMQFGAARLADVAKSLEVAGGDGIMSLEREVGAVLEALEVNPKGRPSP